MGQLRTAIFDSFAACTLHYITKLYTISSRRWKWNKSSVLTSDVNQANVTRPRPRPRPRH